MKLHPFLVTAMTVAGLVAPLTAAPDAAAPPTADPPAGEPAKPAARSYLGVRGDEVPAILGKHLKLEPGTGTVIRKLDPASPAAKAGLAADDVITAVDGQPVTGHRALIDRIRAKQPGEQVAVDFIHAGDKGQVKITLAAAPAKDQPAPAKAPDIIRKSFKIEIDPDKGGIQVKPGDDADDAADADLKAGGNGFSFSSSTQQIVKDKDGTIELKSGSRGKEARVLDNAGKEIWSGPWATEDDKAAAPPDVRERIESANKIQADAAERLKGLNLPKGLNPPAKPEPAPDKAD